MNNIKKLLEEQEKEIKIIMRFNSCDGVQFSDSPYPNQMSYEVLESLLRQSQTTLIRAVVEELEAGSSPKEILEQLDN